jgi:TonB family protein
MVVFCTMSLSQNISPMRIIDVDLAYLPPSEGKPQGRSEPVKEPVKEPEKKTDREEQKIPEPVKKEVKETKKPVVKEKVVTEKKTAEPILDKTKKPLKKESDPQDEIKKTLKALEKNMGAPPKSDPIADRLKRMEKEAKDPGPRGVEGGTGKSEKTGGVDSPLIDRYRALIGQAIKQNWAFSEQLAGKKKKLETRVSFNVMPSGEITGITIVKSSGSEYLDSSATMAIKKSNPVMPHPEGISKPYIEVKLIFTPEGMN